MTPSATHQIRNSTAEFLMFTSQAGDGSIEVRVEEGTVWLSQKLMAQLFEVAGLKRLTNHKWLLRR